MNTRHNEIAKKQKCVAIAYEYEYDSEQVNKYRSKVKKLHQEHDDNLIKYVVC